MFKKYVIPNIKITEKINVLSLKKSHRIHCKYTSYDKYNYESHILDKTVNTLYYVLILSVLFLKQNKLNSRTDI